MNWSRVMVGAWFAIVMSAAALGAWPSFANQPAGPPATPVAVQRVVIPETEFREETAMVLVGAALIGLAAAVRRAA